MGKCFQLEWPGSKKDRTPYFEWMPKEVILQIFSFLNAESLCCAARVNRYWRRLASDNCIWESLLRKNHFITPAKFFSYKSAFIQKYNEEKENKIHRLYLQTLEGKCPTIDQLYYL